MLHVSSVVCSSSVEAHVPSFHIRGRAVAPLVSLPDVGVERASAHNPRTELADNSCIFVFLPLLFCRKEPWVEEARGWCGWMA